MIFVIEDDPIMAECIINACTPLPTQYFSNIISATEALNQNIPHLIFLDILLDGPSGFTLLHELASYTDTANIPVVIISSLDFSRQNLTSYGVVGFLDKATMTPADIQYYVQRYTH